MHRPDQCLLFNDTFAVFTLRVNVRVVVKYRDPEVTAQDTPAHNCCTGHSSCEGEGLGPFLLFADPIDQFIQFFLIIYFLLTYNDLSWCVNVFLTFPYQHFTIHTTFYSPVFCLRSYLTYIGYFLLVGGLLWNRFGNRF